MTMEPVSLILMATYNGENYIEEQLDSILSQTYTNWKLLIRDDGSTDRTVSIIRRYMERDKRIELIQNSTARHGAYINFWSLMEEAKQLDHFDFYFFCDQDDIWPSDRMLRMIEEAGHETESTPLLVYGNMRIIDGEGKTLIDNLDSVMGIGHMSGYTEYYSSGFVWGCNAMINSALFQKTPVFPLENPHVKVMSHDNYYTKFAMAVGKVKYTEKICIEHRRYGSNTTGSYQLKLTPRSVIAKATKGFRSLSKTHALGYVQTLQTISMMRQSDNMTPVASDVEKAILSGGIKGIRIMMKQKVKRKQFSRTLGIYLIMLFGSYKKYMNDF